MATRFIRRDWAVCYCDVVKHGVLTHVGETRRCRNDHCYICGIKKKNCVVKNSTLIWLLTMFYI